MQDKLPITFYLTGTLLLIVIVFFFFISIIVYKSRMNRKEKELLVGLIEEKERTMSTISSEIHDNTNQLLRLSRSMLASIATAEGEYKAELVEDMDKILHRLIGDVRNLSHTLNSEYLRTIGLDESIQEELKWINKSNTVKCELKTTGDSNDFEMEPETELMIFRIAQEAIQNTLKHAEASVMEVRLCYDTTVFSMTISDNGNGFINHPEQDRTGLGMISMHQRAKIIGGRIEIDATPDVGTNIYFQLSK